MDDDLRDLLAGYLGANEPSPEREAMLVARLGTDAAFREIVAAELRMLGMLKVVQSAEPRWLRLADVLGEQPLSSASDDLAESVIRMATARRCRRVQRMTALASVAALVLIALTVWLNRSAWPQRSETTSRQEIAHILHADSVIWDDDASYQVGDAISVGRMRLHSGQLTLDFASGVTLCVEAPADMDFVSADRILARSGKIRGRVPPGAEGFTVRAGGFEILDLGTEFGLNVASDGRAQLMVFEGEAAVSVLGEDGRSVQSTLVGMAQTVEFEPGAKTVQRVLGDPRSFIRLVGKPLPPALPLALTANYREVVLADGPWGYWRSGSKDGKSLPNEIQGGPALQIAGGITVGASPSGDRWIEFHRLDASQSLLMDGVWSPPRTTGYAIELWVNPSAAGSNGSRKADLVALIAERLDAAEPHVALVELTAQGRAPGVPCAVRFLDRWPAGMLGGANVFSRRTFVPGEWHHVVAQRNGDRLELFLDGYLVGSSPTTEPAVQSATEPCRLLIGRLKQRGEEANELRPFAGRLAELALYPRPLSAEEVRRHARLRAGGD